VLHRTRFLLALLACSAGLGASEVVVRHLDRWRPPMPAPEPAPIRRCSDPRIRFENRPGAKQSIRYLDREGNVRTEVVAVNELGCRGRAVPCEKPAGAQRIVVLGDSQTFGAGIDESGTWPAVL